MYTSKHIRQLLYSYNLRTSLDHSAVTHPVLVRKRLARSLSLGLGCFQPRGIESWTAGVHSKLVEFWVTAICLIGPRGVHVLELEPMLIRLLESSPKFEWQRSRFDSYMATSMYQRLKPGKA